MCPVWDQYVVHVFVVFKVLVSFSITGSFPTYYKVKLRFSKFCNLPVAASHMLGF